MKEILVNFTICKLLKELGYKDLVTHYFNSYSLKDPIELSIDGIYDTKGKILFNCNDIGENIYSCPTISQVIEWIKNNYSITPENTEQIKDILFSKFKNKNNVERNIRIKK